MGVAAIDNDVAGFEVGSDGVDPLVYGVTGFHHHHDPAGALEEADKLFDGVSADNLGSFGFVGDEVVDLRNRAVEDGDFEAVVVHVENEILTHDGEADESDITCGLRHVAPLPECWRIFYCIATGKGGTGVGRGPDNPPFVLPAGVRFLGSAQVRLAMIKLWARYETDPACFVRAYIGDRIDGCSLSRPLRWDREVAGLSPRRRMPRLDRRNFRRGRIRIRSIGWGRTRCLRTVVPKGEIRGPFHIQSNVFPGTQHTYWVYVPAQYDPKVPAALMVYQDGQAFMDPKGDLRAQNVMDNLIYRREIPVMLGVFINPGRTPEQPEPSPATEWGDRTTNRPAEYNTPDDKYPRVVTEELMPALNKEYNISKDPEMRGIGGSSSGAIAAFMVAWERPNEFRKVLSNVGSFVDIRGGYVYPERVLASEKKPIRVFLCDGRKR